ncbi:MAG: AAA family ATPase [Clostridiales bacterium]|jgi:predicted AAA+ superfamily ATPase|nr:AAA family ATPase [Clostridiales bacterium]
MKRLIENRLREWKNKSDRMPLVILGARQVGKTYTVFNFGKEHFDDIAVFTFEGNAPLQKIFDLDLDPRRIAAELERISLKKINQDTLIFFDEIQACKNALTSLKYFYEKMPDLPIIAAGSLLGVAVSRGEFSFPVGKVDRLTMRPMTFDEFLTALNEDGLVGLIRECFAKNLPMPENLHERAMRLYFDYLIVGGMPKAVAEYIEKKDFDFARAVQQKIILDYLDDMSKYSAPAEANRTRAVYNSIPYQLARENKKFLYRLVNSSARAATYESGILWLLDGGLISRVNKVKEGKSPLAFYQDACAYKIYMNDVGLLTAKSNIAPALIINPFGLGGEARGALTENYAAEALSANGHTLYYWESGGVAEVDFVLEIDGRAVPVETKSAYNTKSKSLTQFVKKYEPKYSIRISGKNFGFENGIKSVPLYAVFCIKP